jgi:hypothetical protein
LHDVSEKLKIPFLLLFKECVVTKTQFNYQNYTWKKNKEKFKGSKIGVYLKFAKQYLSHAKIANKNNIDIVGCSRLATSFSYKKILPKNTIIYYATEKYRGLPNRYCKAQSKNFFKDLKDYKSYDKKFNWESSH